MVCETRNPHPKPGVYDIKNHVTSPRIRGCSGMDSNTKPLEPVQQDICLSSRPGAEADGGDTHWQGRTLRRCRWAVGHGQPGNGRGIDEGECSRSQVVQSGITCTERWVGSPFAGVSYLPGQLSIRPRKSA